MKAENQKNAIAQLKKQGFKVVKGYANLYLNQSGVVYHCTKGRYLKIVQNRNTISIGTKKVSVPKLILQEFAGETYRAGQIAYIDGDKTNICLSNIRYQRKYPPGEAKRIERDKLLTAIRCYFSVDKNYTPGNQFLTKEYLRAITESRDFFNIHSQKANIKVFSTYLNGIHAETIPNSTTKYLGALSKHATAKALNLSVRDTETIIENFTALLITEILTEMDAGKLALRPYREKNNTINQLNENAKMYLSKISEIKRGGLYVNPP